MTAFAPNVYVLDSVVTSATASTVLKQCTDAVRQGTRVLDFHRVEELDSAALALIIECRRAAERAGVALRCVNLPDNLKSLASLYGVLYLIPQ